MLARLKAASSPLSNTLENKSILLPSLGSTPYLLKRSARRQSLAIRVRQNDIYVSAPHYVSQSEIESFILSRDIWLYEVLEKQSQLPTNKMTYQDGAQLLLLNEWYRLVLKPNNKSRVEQDDNDKVVSLLGPRSSLSNPKYVRRKLSEYLTASAKHLITSRVEFWADKTGLQPTKVSFKFYKNRWGCCYHHGEVRFNPLLMAAPLAVIDCVVIHELCHLKQMNHSAQFWALNESICGCCSDSKSWLNTHHQAMQLPVV